MCTVPRRPLQIAEANRSATNCLLPRRSCSGEVFCKPHRGDPCITACYPDTCHRPRVVSLLQRNRETQGSCCRRIARPRNCLGPPSIPEPCHRALRRGEPPQYHASPLPFSATVLPKDEAFAALPTRWSIGDPSRRCPRRRKKKALVRRTGMLPCPAYLSAAKLLLVRLWQFVSID